MQQPGLQQLPAGWPGTPGLQAPLPQGYPGQSYMVPPPGMPPGYQPAGRPSAPYQAQYQAPPPQPAVQQQAAPVAPVASPGSPYHPNQAPAQGAPQNPAQALARQLVEIARTLEQLFPGYQAIQAILSEMATAPSGIGLPGLNEAIQGVKESLYHHGATLGFIRRLLSGETSPALLTHLSAAYHALQHVHTRTRPTVERALMSYPIAPQSPLAGLLQSAAARTDGLINQVGAGLQAILGPHAWEAGRSRSEQLIAPLGAES